MEISIEFICIIQERKTDCNMIIMMFIMLYLLVRNEGETLITRKTSDTELVERARASRNQHMKQTIKSLRLAVLAPLLNIYVLPAVGTSYCFSPRFADPWNYGEYLFK